MSTELEMAVPSAEEVAAQVVQATLDYQVEDRIVPAGDETSPWIPYGGPGMYIRFLMFDVRRGRFAVLLRTEGEAELGRHKHRLQVDGFTLAGSWGYREYDWVAKAGDLVHESPGAIHTLYSGPEGMLVYFVVEGQLEFFDENDNLADTQDVFWFINHYVQYCKAHQIPVNTQLWD
ncbi:2,4'-dihydroxyacetophenone dioxygenase family protein [Rhodococcus qingshengii]|uniref:2,4'-dihydroxyacetophenone dioxygenase family protein n=1 Tax=Rhodococcus qingshengii TaxID=334542 RepID=UPI0036DAB82B